MAEAIDRPVDAASGLDRRGSLFLAVAGVLAAAMVAVVPLVPYVAAMSLAAAIAVPIVMFVLHRVAQRRFDLFEVLLPVAVLYFLYFGWSAVYLKFHPEQSITLSVLPYVTPALALATVGFYAMLAGYRVGFGATRPSRLGELVPNGSAFYFLAGSLGLIGQYSTYLQSRAVLRSDTISPVLAIGQQLDPLFWMAWFVFWWAVWTRHLRGARLAVLAVIHGLAGLVVLVLQIGTKERAIMLGAVPIMAFWYARRRLPWRSAIAILLLAVFVVFPVYNQFRLHDERLGTLARLDRTVDSARNWDSTEYFDYSVGAFLKRLTIVTSVAAVLRDTGRWVEFEYGRTLFLAPIGLVVPRFLWPDKPNLSIGREFGERFQLVHPLDRRTYIAPSLVGEFYWNFHVPGVVIGMFLYGAWLRWTYRKFGEGGGGDALRKGLYVMFLIGLVHFEGNLAIVFGRFVRSLILAWGLAWFALETGMLVRVRPSSPGSPE